MKLTKKYILECLNLNQRFRVSSEEQLVDVLRMNIKLESQLLSLCDTSNIVDLQKLTSCKANIRNISLLRKLVNLTTLNISRNQISDILPISNLVGLRTLSASENRISDIGPLENLVNVEELHLSINNISNLEPLKDLKLLKLYLDRNQVKDLSPLCHLKQLNVLSLDQNLVIDVTPLQYLPLYKLSLAYNQVQDISPLGHIKFNNLLDISFNQVAQHSIDEYIRDFSNMFQSPPTKKQVHVYSKIKKVNESTKILYKVRFNQILSKIQLQFKYFKTQFALKQGEICSELNQAVHLLLVLLNDSVF